MPSLVLGVGLLTYGDDLRIGVFGNKNLLPRPGQAEEIACGFMQELDDLQFVEWSQAHYANIKCRNFLGKFSDR